MISGFSPLIPVSKTACSPALPDGFGYVLFRLADHLLDAGGMDSPVRDQLGDG